MQLSLTLAASPLRVATLGSGSAGNVLVVESGSRRLMVDAGFSCREIERRLALLGVEADAFDALVLTHEHGDHTRGAARFALRHEVPIYATAGTLDELQLASSELTCHTIRSGQPAEVGSFVVEPFAVPHDAREPAGLVVEDASGRRVGLAAGLGTRGRLAWSRLTDLDVLVLETNHDLEMLRNGPYPWPLKQRVAGRHGHLSNREAAEGLPELVSDRLRWVVLYHLSRVNNLPFLAEESVAAELDKAGARTEICVSDQFAPTPWLKVDRRPMISESAGA